MREVSIQNQLELRYILLLLLIWSKCPSNCIKNDSRFFEHPQDCSSSDSERGFGKEKVVCTLVPRSLIPEQRDDRVISCQDIIMMADADKKIF